MDIIKLNSMIRQKIVLLAVLLSIFSVSPSFAQYTGIGNSFEGGRGLLYMQSARTYGKACYSIGMQSLAMQREYFVIENNIITIPKNNTTVIGVPVTVGVTDIVDLSAGFYFFHDARPYRNDLDIYDYHSSSESGIGATRLGLKIRLPFDKGSRLQIAGKFGAMVNTSQKHIDGMNYRWTRNKETDVEASLLETIDLNSYMSLYLEEGYVLSGSDIYDDQLVFGAGIDVHPFNKLSFGLELHNRTFMGISPQSLNRSMYAPFTYWDDYRHLGDPAYINDDDLDFTEDFFVLIPSVSYRINDFLVLNAGAIINIADQKGPQETAQFAVGITYNRAMKFFVDTDKDGIRDSRDREPDTPKGYPIDSRGVSLDTDRDGVADGKDKQPNTPVSARVDQWGVALDSDYDGVYDGIDREPDTPEGYEVDDYGVALDDDGDGVYNGIDREPDTPEGCEVDDYGVALDDDEDGVPNYLDKELDSPKGVQVDQQGVTIIPKKKEVSVGVLPYSIHVSSFKELIGAKRDVFIYTKRGYDAFYVLTEIPKMGNWYRVYIGRFRTEAEAQDAAEILKKRGYTEWAKVMKFE